MRDRHSTVAGLAAAFSGQTASQRLETLRATLPGRIVFTSSLGLEDQVITHLIAAAGLDIDIVTLDTGRLFPESYTLWRETEERYGIRIRGFYPRGEDLEKLVNHQGIDGFYQSIDARHACCNVRKIEPLNRALAGASGWITGLRGDASQNRAAMDAVVFDTAHGLVKLSPIFDWSREETAAFAQRENIPVSPLHAQGFVSIGCAPCTRALLPGEPERAGRWWWEQDDARECGLHVDDSGRLVRSKTQAGAPPT